MTMKNDYAYRAVFWGYVGLLTIALIALYITQ